MKKRYTSTLGRFDSKLIDQETSLIASYCPNPDNIYWNNVDSGIHRMFWRKLFIFLFALLIILFFTTPSTLIQYLGFNKVALMLKKKKFFKNEELNDFLQKNISPLIILGVNQILILLIDIATFSERDHWVNNIQLSIFYKSVIYLTINMLIVPLFTLTGATSLFGILVKHKV